jgi:hypothetical protein
MPQDGIDEIDRAIDLSCLSAPFSENLPNIQEL